MKKYLLFIVLVLFGCSGKNNQEDSAQVVSMRYSEMGPPPAMAKEVDSKDISFQQKIILKNARMVLIVDNYDSSFNYLKKTINEKNGIIINCNVYVNSDNTKKGIVELKVPAESLDVFLASIKKTAKRVESESITTVDYTEEYIDIKARINNKRALEKRYGEILKTAKTTKDLLEIEEQLSTVRGDIESIESRIKYLEKSSAMSEVNLEINEPGIVRENTDGVWSGIKNSFNNGFYGFFNILGITLSVLISAIPIFVLIFLLYKFFKKAFKNWRINKENNPAVKE